ERRPGGPTVVAARLGASVPDGFEPHSRDRCLSDGRATVASGGWVGPDHAPTFRLAGDEPVSVMGTVLHLSSDVAAGWQLRRFRVETSLDGVGFETILEGELSASRDRKSTRLNSSHVKN